MKGKRLGIVSGMGTRAGLLFLEKLINSIEAPTDQDFPEFILHNNSQIPDRTLAIKYGGQSPKKELIRSIRIMNSCNVDYIVSTCITSYFFLDQLNERQKQNILNPINLIAAKINKHYSHHKRIGLLATTGTINSQLFQRRFINSPFELITLDSLDQEEKFMKSVYMKGGFKSASISKMAYTLFNSAVENLMNKGVDIIIGGCTEVQIGFDGLQTEINIIDAIDVLIEEVIIRMNLKRRKAVLQ